MNSGTDLNIKMVSRTRKSNHHLMAPVISLDQLICQALQAQHCSDEENRATGRNANTYDREDLVKSLLEKAS